MTDNLNFMTPELLKRRKDYHKKVDVYAFRVVFFIILIKGEYPEIGLFEMSNGK